MSGWALAQCANLPAISARGVTEPSMPNAPNAPNSGPSSSGRQRGYRMPVAPPAQRNQVPEPDIVLVRNAAVLARAVDHLRLHPQRTGFRFRMPERFAARAAAHQVDGLKLLPGLIAFARRDEGEAPKVDLGRGSPFVVCARRQRFQRARDAVRADQVFGIELAETARCASAADRRRRRCGTAASRGSPDSRRNRMAARHRPRTQ